MNSQKLKNLHPEVYSKFFNEHEVVISFPVTIDWSIAAYSNSNPPCIKQKIPLRIYFWVRRQNEFKIDRIQLYNHFEQSFYTQDGILTTQNSAISLLNQAVKEYCGKRKLNISGYTIDILSEIGDNLDLWYNFNIFFGTIIAIENFLDREFCIELMEISNRNINDIYSSSRIWSIFKDILLIYRKHLPSLPYATLITIFFNWAYQFFTLRNNEIIDKDTSIEDRINFFWFSINELTKLSDLNFSKAGSFTQNFDLALVYSWIGTSLKSNFAISWWIQSLMYDQGMVKILNNAILSVQTWEEGAFDLRAVNSISLLRDNLGLITLVISDILLKLMSINYYPNLVDHLIYTVNKLNKAFSIFYNHPQKYSSMISELDYMFNSEKESVWIFPFDMAEWGWCFSLISNTEHSRKKISQVIEDYKEKHKNSSMCTIFESRSDGYEYDWIKIEQDVRNWIYSPFINRSNCTICHHDWSIEFIDESLLDLGAKDDVVINMVNNRIYILWKKLTSKELTSQITTVEVLNLLLSKPSHELKSSELGSSSYKRSKNDMLSKVIAPIKKIVESSCSKDLHITCNWNNNSYTIKLNLWKVKFGIIRKNTV